MNTIHRCIVGVATLAAVAVSLTAVATADPDGALGAAQVDALRLGFDGESYGLSLNGDAAFHVTTNEVRNQRLVEVPGSPVLLVLWNEMVADEQSVPYYAISLDGQRIARVRQASYVLKLHHGDFDPAVAVPPPDAGLAASAASGLYIVQFYTQPLEEFRTAITSLGGTVHQFLANHAHFVRMSPEVRDQVAALPYVRWIGPVHPAYKLEEAIRDQIRAGATIEPRRYSIMLHERGVAAQSRVCAQIGAIGGQVHGTTPRGFRIEATMSLDQVCQIAALDDVMFIDRKGQTEVDMDIVREIGGANYIETVAGYTGQGVRAEVADTELDTDHQEWGAPPIIHRAGSDTAHGTSVYGILFAQGVVPQARGLIPDGVGIFACSTNGLLGGGPTRYEHTAELVDPDDLYRAVLQTNSTGDPRTYYYTTISAEMDDMLFMYDIVLTQSQSNAGDQDSRPQAWAKNIISGGAVNHYNTLTRDDDCWCYDASIGPADDGRIKPDLCFFYDDTYTATAGGGYTEFGGTSGATPSIAGHVGLFFQMWSDGIFGNEDDVDPNATVFENRCHMTTAKAVMINTATQYSFSGTGHDLTRVHQGWGMPDVAYLYDMRDNISILDETEVLGNLQSAEYIAFVEPGTPELRITMVYADPAGVPGSSQHRINDLSLHVVSPTGTEYWGNNGLLEGNWSTPDGVANEIDTVENVFVQNPESGVWDVAVIASEVNEDGHVETPELDADFALVVSGGLLSTCTSTGRVKLDSSKYQCEDQAAIRVVDCDLNLDPNSIDAVDVMIESTSEPGGETVHLVETAAATADFRGVIDLSTVDAAGVLQVSEGDLVTVTYEDADDGSGSPATVQETADIDCTAPSIFNVQVVNIGPRDATVTFDTDEPTVGAVRYGESCAALTETATQAGYGTEHSVHLTGLTDNSTYFFVVDAQDVAGNSVSDDNGGSCYTFDTTDIPDFFTEEFGSDNDLDYLSLYLTPNGSVDYYAGCVKESDSLPTDPSGGTPLSISEDSYDQVSLGGGETVSLYGVSYSSFYVCDNGYITFGSGDSDWTETLEDHFDMPRISALFDDFSVDNYDGFVSWKQEADRAVVTYENVPEYGTSNNNTFQVEMYFNGDIAISYLTIDATDGIAGLSEGAGVDPDFYETDLSALGDCGAQPPVAENDSVTTVVNTPITITLNASDDGLPEPAALDYIIVSLPTNGTLSDPGAGAIESVPYTLVAGGNDAVYTPDSGYTGSDGFTFKANDGGTPPEGGDSNIATIDVEITPAVPEPVYDFPLDSDPGWNTEGQWAFGQPTGGGSHDGDPSSGHTGSNVYGYNLNGDYGVNMPMYYLTTPALDCSSLTAVELRFWRWLGVESSNFDRAGLEVSNDGSSWTTLWSNPLTSISDSAWSQMTFDISAVADGEPTVYIRWWMGPTDGSVTYPGWNIDDVEIWATEAQCPGDLDGDNDVDIADLAQLLAHYGMTNGASYEDGDLDSDGDVDLNDLAELLSLYGTTC